MEGGGGHAEILGAAGGSFVLLVAVLRDVTSAREAGSLHLVKLRDGEGEILPAMKCKVNFVMKVGVLIKSREREEV